MKKRNLYYWRAERNVDKTKYILKSYENFERKKSDIIIFPEIIEKLRNIDNSDKEIIFYNNKNNFNPQEESSRTNNEEMIEINSNPQEESSKTNLDFTKQQKKQNKVLGKRKNNDEVDTKMLQIQQNYQKDLLNKKQKLEENGYQKDMDFETDKEEIEKELNKLLMG